MSHSKKHIKMNKDKKRNPKKVDKPEEAKGLSSKNEALPNALQNFSKAFAEYYKGFML